MDTAKDYRILVLEDALRRLNELVGNRRFKMHVEYSKLNEALKQAGSLIYEVKYSYLTAPQVADLEATSKIIDQVASYRTTLENAIKSSGYKPSTAKDHLTLAEAFYSFRVAEGFKRRLRVESDEPGLAVDIIAVEVSQVQQVPESKNLSECRCTDGNRIWRIVTNIHGLKPGVRLVCADLPPAEMMGVVSEAMFLGGKSLPDNTTLGLMTEPPPAAVDQARAQVLQIAKRMT
jgi:predicted RNA-binding protein with EMAP domain